MNFQRNMKAHRAYLILILSISLFLIDKVGLAQNESFSFTNYSNRPQSIHDVTQMEGAYFLVGEHTTADEIAKPWYLKLSSEGNFLLDSVLTLGDGYFSNVSAFNGGLILSYSNGYVGGEFVEAALAGGDENFNFTTLFGSQAGYVQNVKKVDNIHYLTIGYESVTNFIHLGTIKKYNINTTWDDSYYIELFESAFPINMYDIIKTGNTYRLFLRDYESANPSDVMMLTLSEDFEIIASSPLQTSYQEFGSDGKFYGPVSAYALSDSTYLVHGSAPHPVSENEENVRDAATAVFDTAGTELSLIFTGAPDTNAFASRHSIAAGDGFFYLAGTKNFDGEHNDETSYFMLSKMDAAGTVLWTKYYGNETSLKLTNVIATDDGGALMVGESQYTDNAPWYNIYVVKVDANGDLTAVENGDKPVFSSYVFPNPTSSQIQFHIPENQNEKLHLTISTLTGKRIESRIYRTGDKIDISNYPNGFYLYHLAGSDYESSGKMVIQK